MAEPQVISVLAWAFIVVGGAFCVMLSWFAVRIVTQLDHLTDMVVSELHKHEVRLTRLEERQELRGRRSGDIDRRSDIDL